MNSYTVEHNFTAFFAEKKKQISQVSSLLKPAGSGTRRRSRWGEKKSCHSLTPTLLCSQFIGFFPQLWLKDFPVVLFQRFFSCQLITLWCDQTKKMLIDFSLKVYDCNLKIWGKFCSWKLYGIATSISWVLGIGFNVENSLPSQVLLAASSFTLRQAFCTTCLAIQQWTKPWFFLGYIYIYRRSKIAQLYGDYNKPLNRDPCL